MLHHLRRSVSLLTLLALAACASAKPVATASNPTPPVPADTLPAAEAGPGSMFSGTWYVSGVFPTAMAQASVADPHLGTALTIAESEVSDINGQRCINPVFANDQVDATVAGLKVPVAGNWDRLVVSCNGKSFATYLRLPDQPGSTPALLQQRREGLYLLEQAGAVLHRQPGEYVADPQPEAMAVAHAASDTVPPAHKEAAAQTHAATTPVDLTPPAAKVSAPAPVPEGPVAVSQPQPAAKASATDGGKLPAMGTAIHLASYKGESAAKRGWKILLGEYDELDPLSPLYVTVDVPGKGAIIRLYANGAGEAELVKICAALKAKKVYCALNP